MRQRMTFRFVTLDDEPSLAVWIFAVGEFLVPVGSEGGQVVAQGLGYFQGFSNGISASLSRPSIERRALGASRK